MCQSLLFDGLIAEHMIKAAAVFVLLLFEPLDLQHVLSLSDADGNCRVNQEYRLIVDGKRFTFEVLNQGSNDRNECTKEND